VGYIAGARAEALGAHIAPGGWPSG